MKPSKFRENTVIIKNECISVKDKANFLPNLYSTCIIIQLMNNQHFTVIDTLSLIELISTKMIFSLLLFGILCPCFEIYHVNGIKFMASTKWADLSYPSNDKTWKHGKF